MVWQLFEWEALGEVSVHDLNAEALQPDFLSAFAGASVAVAVVVVYTAAPVAA